MKYLSIYGVSLQGLKLWLERRSWVRLTKQIFCSYVSDRIWVVYFPIKGVVPLTNPGLVPSSPVDSGMWSRYHDNVITQHTPVDLAGLISK